MFRLRSARKISLMPGTLGAESLEKANEHGAMLKLAEDVRVQISIAHCNYATVKAGILRGTFGFY